MIFFKGFKSQLIFLITVFVFLFWSGSVFATCSTTTWNNSSCDVNIIFTDPGTEKSGLDECLYAVKSGADVACPLQSTTDSDWSSAFPCSGETTSYMITNALGSAGSICVNQGLDVCRVCSLAADAAGNMSPVNSQQT